MACVIRSAYDRLPHAFRRDELFLLLEELLEAEALPGDAAGPEGGGAPIVLVTSRIELGEWPGDPLN